MLYGREAEQDVVDRLLERAAQGVPGSLVVRGEAGLGKSALLEYAEAAARGRVLRVTGVESETELPFAALHVLLGPVLDEVGRVPRRQGEALLGALGLGADAPGDRFLVGLAALSLLTELAAEEPLLCLVDDAHWLDRESADALLFAVRRLRSEPVTTIFATRADAGVFPAPGVPELRLAGLDGRAARALADSTTTLAPWVRDQVVAEADGNPLALVELPRLLTPEQRAGALPSPGFAAGVTEPPLGRVLSAFRERIRELPAVSRLCLLVAALEGTGKIETVAGAAAALGAELTDLAAAEHAGLVRVASTGVEFRHPLVRTATRLACDVAERVAAHRALAGTVDDDRRAWHLAAVATAPDEAVAAALERAAVRGRRRGGQVAVAAAYERAAELSPAPEAALRRWVAAAGAALEAGLPGRAEELTARAATGRPPDEPRVVAELARVRAALAFESGRPLDAARLLCEGVETFTAADEVTRLTMLGWAAVYVWAGRPHPDRLALARRIEDLAPELPGPLGAVHAIARDVRLMLEGDQVAATIAPYSLGQEEDLPFDLRVLSVYLGFGRGDVDGMYRDALRLVDACRAAGRIGRMPQAMGMLAIAELATGRHPSARSTASEGRRLADDVEQPHWTHYLSGVDAWLAGVAGDEERCRALAEEVLAADDAWITGYAWATCALIALDSALGRHDRVLDRFDKAMTGPARDVWLWRYTHPDYVEAAVRAGDPERARPVAARLARWAEAIGQPWARAVSARCQAMLTEGDAADLYEQALELHRRGDQPFEQARTELVYGEWLRRHNRRADARAQLRSAMAAFDRLGASAWSRRAAAELRASGISLPESPAGDRARDPLAALTPQELQVVRLAATGATNREIGARLFLSARTVAYHLYKAFPKLGISSRAELARYVST
ncbi:hypothetical protein amrb99_85920 [Actinomadura sp. RB99]|nr:helix-turn-helix transcriptional regulator [Actinomadura sp. RB99]MBD2899608.1 hypothetical protein [Actinomadura sp. RB99]